MSQKLRGTLTYMITVSLLSVSTASSFFNAKSRTPGTVNARGGGGGVFASRFPSSLVSPFCARVQITCDSLCAPFNSNGKIKGCEQTTTQWTRMDSGVAFDETTSCRSLLSAFPASNRLIHWYLQPSTAADRIEKRVNRKMFWPKPKPHKLIEERINDCRAHSHRGLCATFCSFRFPYTFCGVSDLLPSYRPHLILQFVCIKSDFNLRSLGTGCARLH